ncbi:MAG: Lar family restriction alleviation protein [Oscillospiraceae bacterium]|nr:Lar family restriction alleviation protein [Oscillospiraceae bacterium]
MSFWVWLRCYLTSPVAEERLAAKIHLTSMLGLRVRKARNILRRRRRCPECGRRPIIWGNPRYICFCGCGHCILHCRGRTMKDAIRAWNARETMYKDGKPFDINKTKENNYEL